MIFEKIGLIDSSFQYQSDMTVVTKGNRIVYIGSEKPSEEITREGGPVYDGTGKYFCRDSTMPTAIPPCV